MNQIFGWLIAYAIGFAYLWFGIGSARRSIEASNWPSVTGTITKLSLRENSYSDGKTYGVEVEYCYSVRGRTYTSSRLAFGYGADSNRQVHQDILNKLTHASSVKVRYNPQNPAISTLSFGIHGSIRISLVFAIGWLVTLFGFTLNSFIKSGIISILISSILFLAVIIWIPSMIWVLCQPDKTILKNIKVLPN